MHKQIISGLALLLSFLILPFSPVHAMGLGTAGNYNAFVFQNFIAPSSDVEGRLAAGGNVSINKYSVADKLTGIAPSDCVLVAGGSITFPSGRIYFGSAIAGGSIAGVGKPVLNGMAKGATVTGNKTIPINFTAEQGALTSLSARLSTLPANGTYVFQWGGFTLKGDGVSSLQVFQLNGSDVKTANTFTVSGIPAGATVIFNISGSAAGLGSMGMSAPEKIRSQVLFNFYEAAALSLGSVSVEGSILAPQADITAQSGVVKGTVIAKSWNGAMQLNHNPFTGKLPEDPTLISLSSFTATPKSGRVILTWSTESEIDNAGFNIYRAESKDGEYRRINETMILSEGAATSGASYTFKDAGAKNRRTYYYKLEDVDISNAASLHGPVSATPLFIYGIIDSLGGRR